ncbi:MAG: hypothetical protein ABI175_26305, partial [Polyangiales bacterium]
SASPAWSSSRARSFASTSTSRCATSAARGGRWVTPGPEVAAGGAIGTGAVALVSGAVGLGQSAYMLWCLRQGDVQSWMFHRSLKLDV